VHRAQSLTGRHGVTAVAVVLCGALVAAVLASGLAADIAVLAIAAGAGLYVRRLRVRVGALRQSVDDLRAEQIERADRISGYERARRTDAVTGLGNREQLEAALPRLVIEAGSSMSSLALLVLELDGLAAYCVAHGDDEGDQGLKALVSGWQAHMRMNDVLVRVSATEFVAVLPACSPSNAERVAKRLAAATPSDFVCSIGVASWDGAETCEQLLRRAESATRAAGAAHEPVLVAS
jgi:diguanylate cyclase (GGDEF)-like protein